MYPHTCTNTHTHAHIHTHKHTHIHAHTNIYIHVHTYTCTYTHTHIHTHAHIHTHTQTHTHTHTHTHKLHVYPVCIIYSCLNFLLRKTAIILYLINWICMYSTVINNYVNTIIFIAAATSSSKCIARSMLMCHAHKTIKLPTAVYSLKCLLK